MKRIFKFFRKQNGDVVEFIIDEDEKTITKYVNSVAVKNKVSYEGLLSYSPKLIGLCSDNEERNKVSSL